jgi:hypothetical protein
MAVRYRKHLILPTIDRDGDTGSGQQLPTFRLLKISVSIMSASQAAACFQKKEAEKHILEQAKDWIDERLH